MKLMNLCIAPCLNSRHGLVSRVHNGRPWVLNTRNLHASTHIGPMARSIWLAVYDSRYSTAPDTHRATSCFFHEPSERFLSVMFCLRARLVELICQEVLQNSCSIRFATSC